MQRFPYQVAFGQLPDELRCQARGAALPAHAVAANRFVCRARACCIGLDTLVIASLPPALRRHAETLRTVAGRDGSVMVATNIGVMAIRLVGTMVLTRLLDSSAFGIVAIMTSVSVMALMLSNLGHYAYIVREERADDPVFLDKIWSIRILTGMVQATTIWLLAWPLTLFLGKPEVFWVICTAGLLMFVGGFNSLTFATAARAGLVRRLTMMEGIAVVVQTCFAITLAALWQSYWAMIVAIVTTTLLREWSYYFVFPNAWRRWNFDLVEFRRLWAFGRFIAASSIIEIMISQADKLVLAKFFPIAVFGLYMLAVSLSEIPNSIIANYVGRIIYPIVAKARTRPAHEVADVIYATGQKLRVLYMIMCGGLAAGAPFVIELLYDNRYRDAAFFLQILAVGVVFKLPQLISAEYLIAIGKVRLHLFLNAIRLGALLTLGLLGFHFFGPTGVVLATVATQIVAYFYCIFVQWQSGHLRSKSELGYFALAVAGFAIGWPINALLLSLIRD